MDKKSVNFLSRIELQGFKSFASKTVFDFPERITCIVGPNGSGKSNIIDAIRWVLGERESKNLRGEGIENLIFSGTPKRAAAGIARVDLFFNNRERIFPLDTEEVVLSRKADRSGTSSIYLNDSDMKLKDLLPLLAKMRLGSRGITIIGQGQSDIFVASSPKERREMIEEVLGLKEFRIKKSQAEKRLENSLINIDKIKATLEELAPQVRVFKKQKARLEKREELEKELKNLENIYFAFKFNSFNKILNETKTPLKELLNQKNILIKEISEKEKKLNEFYKKDFYQELEKVKAQINKLWEEKIFKERELFKLEAKQEAKKESHLLDFSKLQEVVEYVRLEIKNALNLNELGKIKTVLANILNKLDSLYKKEEKTETENDYLVTQKNLNQEIKILEKDLENLKAQERELEEKTKTENLIFKEEVEILNDKKNELYKLEGKIQEINLKRESIELKIQDLIREWNALGREEMELKNLPFVESLEEKELREMEVKMNRLRGELIAIGEIDENVFREFENAEQKFNFLSEQLRDLEKASADLKTLIKNLDEQIKGDFRKFFKEISLAFNEYFNLMFGGGKAKLVLEEKREIFLGKIGENYGENLKEENNNSENEKDEELGVEIELNLPRKKIKSINMLSGGEKTLVSLAALFALISISPPPFLVLDEIDAALDEENARRFAELIKQFSPKTQFIIVTHNRATMEAADVLYGVTMGDDGVSKVLSVKLDQAADA